jgi:hypothetical protein
VPPSDPCRQACSTRLFDAPAQAFRVGRRHRHLDKPAQGGGTRLDALQAGHLGFLELLERGALLNKQLQRATDEIGRPGQDSSKGGGVGRRDPILQGLAEVSPEFFESLHRLVHNLRQRVSRLQALGRFQGRHLLEHGPCHLLANAKVHDGGAHSLLS